MNVFISYRRSDTQDLAGRLADRIRAVPQIQCVFMDVDDIAPGVDFPDRIQRALSESHACILLIGPQWLGRGASDQPARILEDRDFVRREAATALAGDRLVLPVLANGARMPQAEELPADLRRLPRINALSIRHVSFDRDVDHLIDVLLERQKPGALGTYLKQHPIQALAMRAAGGGLGAAVVLVFAAAIHGAITGLSLDEALGGQGQVWLLIVAVLVAGAVMAVRLPSRMHRS
jgi:hypothetical protein